MSFSDSIKKFFKNLSITYSIFLISCIIGFLWNVISISLVYFAYETNVSVNLDDESQIFIPPITICSRINYIVKNKSINFDEKCNQRPKFINDNTFNIYEIMIYCSPRLKDYYKYENYTNCQELNSWGFKFETTVNSRYKCYSIIHPQLKQRYNSNMILS
jgi:hypothetical protein